MRKIKKPILTLTLTNNTGAALPVELFNTSNPDNIANATHRYQWNITGVAFTNPITIQYRNAGSTDAYIILFTSFATASAQGLIDALNALNIGVFWIETSGANTFVVSFNDNLQYGDLTIGVPAYVQVFSFGLTSSSVKLSTVITFTSSGVANGYIDWGDNRFSYFSQSGVIILSHDYFVPANYTATIFMSNSPLFVVKLGATNLINVVNGLPALTNLGVLNLNANALITINISSNPALLSLIISNNQLPVADINASLIALDGFGLLNGSYNSLGQTPAAAPTGAGAVAKANLIGKGWTVITD